MQCDAWKCALQFLKKRFRLVIRGVDSMARLTVPPINVHSTSFPRPLNWVVLSPSKLTLHPTSSCSNFTLKMLKFPYFCGERGKVNTFLSASLLPSLWGGDSSDLEWSARSPPLTDLFRPTSWVIQRVKRRVGLLSFAFTDKDLFHPYSSLKWPRILVYPTCREWWNSWNLRPVWRESR